MRHRSFLNTVFAEGLTIVAWVSMWEALATFLLNWPQHLFHIRLFRKIAEAPVLFQEPPSDFSDGTKVRRDPQFDVPKKNYLPSILSDTLM